MPSVRARRLCPDAVFLPPDFDAYRMHSNRFREVLLAHTPLVEPISLDEAFLDCSGATTLFGEPVRIAEKIRAEVVAEVGVTCSAGVASTKFVAKLASDHRKPDALVHVPVEQTLAFLDPLPVGRLWGVGEKTADLLGRLAIRTIGDLARTPRTVLDRLLGEASAAHLTELAHGFDDREVIPYEAPKSVGHEETFERDLDDTGEILRELLHCPGAWPRLRDDGYRARTVTLKVRLANFTTLSRARTLPTRPTWAPISITSSPSCTARCRGPVDGCACWASRRRVCRLPAPNSSRCCARALGRRGARDRSHRAAIRKGLQPGNTA
jgi:DNA polymerase-4